MNPHDAEEALKPYLGRVYDAKVDFGSIPAPLQPEAIAYANALRDALNHAMRMLGLVDSV